VRRHVWDRTGVVAGPGVAFTEPVSSPENVPPTTNSGFGLRMEKVLRAAQREAAEIIASAQQDAASLLSRSRLDAEAEDRERRQGWAAAETVRQGRLEVERLERVRDASRADLDRVVRTLGGMRDALAYELEARPGDPSHAAPQAPGSSNSLPQPRGIGIGTRPGDFRRARTAGIVPDPESGSDGTPPRATHGSATRH
jgi:hypothetical protein